MPRIKSRTLVGWCIPLGISSLCGKGAAQPTRVLTHIQGGRWTVMHFQVPAGIVCPSRTSSSKDTRVTIGTCRRHQRTKHDHQHFKQNKKNVSGRLQKDKVVGFRLKQKVAHLSSDTAHG